MKLNFVFCNKRVIVFLKFVRNLVHVVKHIILGIPATLRVIFRNLIAITQTSMKCMLAYLSISQIGNILIGI